MTGMTWGSWASPETEVTREEGKMGIVPGVLGRVGGERNRDSLER